MEGTLARAAAGSTIKAVLQILFDISIEEVKLVRSFKNDLTKLRESLLMIDDFLSHAMVNQVNNRAVERWLEQLEDVAFGADAVLDEFNYELLRRKVEKSNQTSKKVYNFFTSIPTKLHFSWQMAHKTREMSKNLMKINKEAKSFGLQMFAVVAHQATFLDLQTDSFSVEANIVGRQDDVLRVVGILVTAPPEEKIYVVPILGMGGIGKTTLARHVFHHEKIGTHFQRRIWVCVSYNFDATTLFKMILQSLSGENVQVIMTREVVLEKIREHLVKKRYFLVLDDVWNENKNEWDDFFDSLAGISSVSGNGIVVTTRKEIVASNVRTFATHRLGHLLEDECWSIIRAKSFLGKDMHIEFRNIGKCIARKCGGLPLAARIVGGLLHGVKSKDEWLSFLNDQLSKFGQDDDTVMKILKLSYDRLPSSSLKKCFAYCSIFSQDARIERKQLIQLWMAEGFVQADRGKDMETMANRYFNYLLQCSLFEQAVRDEYGNITYCGMHDLVHDLATSISGSRTINTEDGRFNGTRQARYVSIDSVTDESFAALTEQSKCIRTIFFGSNIAENMFMNFRDLHVLKLRSKDIQELPSMISKLIHLRLLDISFTKIKILPDSVGKLYNLQTLCVPDLMEKLPSVIINLISLRHLHIPCIELPLRIGTLHSLQTLPYYKVGHEEGRGIGELGKLTNLNGVLEIQNLERVKDKEEARHADLFGKPNIFRLVFKWNESSEGQRTDDYVLEGMQPHPNLKSFEIIGYTGRNFPLWTMKMTVENGIEGHRTGLDNLTHIKLINCKNCEEAPMLGQLQHLKFLKLSGLSSVETLGLSFYGLEKCNTSSTFDSTSNQPTTITFPALERLELLEMSKLTELVDVDGVDTMFPCVKKLHIESCPLLQWIPSHFPCCEKLKLKFCPKLYVMSRFGLIRKIEFRGVQNVLSL